MKIKVCLIKGEDKVLESIVLGNIIDNIISFKIEDMLNTIDINKEFFIRENDEYKFFLDFLNKSCILTLKKENYSLDINVDKCNFEVFDNKIIIDYYIETDECNNNLIIEWND